MLGYGNATNIDYTLLSGILKREMRRRGKWTEDKKDFCKGKRIDDIVSHTVLKHFNPEVVFEFALDHGCDVDVCRYGTKCDGHETPIVRANGVWLGLPEQLATSFEIRGDYRRQETDTMCPSCADRYKQRLEALRENYRSGNRVQPLFKFTQTP